MGIAIFIGLLLWLVGFLLLWRVPRCHQEKASCRPTVAVIIPARNEAHHLPRLLQSLATQSLSATEVVVVDDDSEDETAQIAAAYGATVLRLTQLPAGVNGKAHAAGHGAQAVRAELLVFLDADTWLAPDGLAKLVDTWAASRGLLSVQPFHVTHACYERLAVLFSILPVIGTGAFSLRQKRRPAAGAFGPCIVCRRADYEALGGHCRVQGERLEHFALGRLFSAQGHALDCRGGQGTLCYRMYSQGWREQVRGLSKSFARGAQLTPPLILIGSILWLCGAFTALEVAGYALATRPPLLSGAVLGSIGLYALYALQLHWMYARLGRFGRWPALLFFLPLLYFVGLYTWALIIDRLLGRSRWKGRRMSGR